MAVKTISSRLGYQQVNDLHAAVGLDVPLKDVGGSNVRPVFALIVPEGGDVRWRDDGVDPDHDLGMPLAEGAAFQYDGDLSAIRFIGLTAGVKLNVAFYA